MSFVTFSCCHCHVFFNVVFFLSLIRHTVITQLMQNSQLWILTIPSQKSSSRGPMGLQIAWRGVSLTLPLWRVYLPLPTSDVCVSTVEFLLVYLSKTPTLLYVTVLSDQEHMTTKSKLLLLSSFGHEVWLESVLICDVSALSTCCCWRGNRLCESIPKWLTAHLCMYTFVIEM